MYIVLKGTAVRVRNIDGAIVPHVMKRTVAIPGGEAQMVGYDLHYKIGERTLIVQANETVYVNSQCPQCKRLL